MSRKIDTLILVFFLISMSAKSQYVFQIKDPNNEIIDVRFKDLDSSNFYVQYNEDRYFALDTIQLKAINNHDFELEFLDEFSYKLYFRSIYADQELEELMSDEILKLDSLCKAGDTTLYYLKPKDLLFQTN